MRVGVGLPSTLPNADRDLLISWATKADAGPFGSLGVFDRLPYHSLDPLPLLAAVAVLTTRIRLATTILTAPLRNTALLAKEAATIDVLSNGRLTLGLAVGARLDDYTAAGVAHNTRGKRLDEQLVALKDQWESDTIGPKPVQPNGPPILIGGTTDAAFSRAARFADGYIHGGGPPRAFASAADKARAAWIDGGRPGKPALWAMGYYALDSKHAEAGAAYLRHYYAFTGPFSERIAAGLLTTPQAVEAFVRGYADAGCDDLVLFPTAADPEELDRLADVIG